MTTARALLLIALAIPASSFASDRNGGSSTKVDTDERQELPPVEFLERSSIFYALPNVGPVEPSPLVFEGNIATHLFFYDALTALERQSFSKEDWLWTVAFTMQVRLRMVADASVPVRPASLMPRMDAQVFHVTGFGEDVWPLHHRAFDLLELRGSLGHHSNGQQYCEFAAGVPDSVQGTPCPAVDPLNPPLAQLNYRAGDFSTNYVIGGAHFARIFTDANDIEMARGTIGALYEDNPLDFLTGGLDSAEYPLYGAHRILVTAGASLHPWRLSGKSTNVWTGIFRLNATGEAMLGGRVSAIPYDRETVELSYVFDGLGGVGLVARYVHGQDYMNVLFLGPPLSVVQFGVVWDPSPRMKYGFMDPE